MVNRIVAVCCRCASPGTIEAAAAGKELPAHPCMDRFVVGHGHVAELPEMNQDARDQEHAVEDPFGIHTAEIEPSLEEWCADRTHSIILDIRRRSRFPGFWMVVWRCLEWLLLDIRRR